MNDKTPEKKMEEWVKQCEDARKENLAYWCREAGPIGPALWGFNSLIKFLSK
jgi:hypothetical protein